MQIDIDFEVFKAITAKRQRESHSYNDVLREMLGLPERVPSARIEVGDSGTKVGRVIGGRFLPADTELRSTYKGQTYTASIIGNELVLAGGQKFRTASAAAKEITKTNVNGLTFWEVKRPGDTHWSMIRALPKDSQ